MDNIEHFEADISDKGIKLEGHGYKGNQCVKDSAPLEAAIGNGTTRNLKAAFYAKVVAPVKNKLGW